MCDLQKLSEGFKRKGGEKNGRTVDAARLALLHIDLDISRLSDYNRLTSDVGNIIVSIFLIKIYERRCVFSYDKNDKSRAK